jgi:hypothetical protein
MNAQEIKREVAEFKANKLVGSTVLFNRGTKVWWLHYYGYGNVEIEVCEYGVN